MNRKHPLFPTVLHAFQLNVLFLAKRAVIFAFSNNVLAAMFRSLARGCLYLDTILVELRRSEFFVSFVPCAGSTPTLRHNRIHSGKQVEFMDSSKNRFF